MNAATRDINLASGDSMVLASATSYHPLYNAESIIDGTGLYPQEIIFTWKKEIQASKVLLSCIKVAQIEILMSKQDIPTSFESIHVQELVDSDSISTFSFSIPESCHPIKHVKILVHKGFGPFVAINRLDVYGMHP